MKNYKWYSLLLVILALLLAISFTGCAPSYIEEELDAAREASYTEGYNDGFTKGEVAKKEEVKQSYDQGYKDGDAIGYKRGEIEGYNRGLEQGKLLGYDEGRKACRGVAIVCLPPYIGSKNSDVYHCSWCRNAAQIYPENKIWFSFTSDARAHGYRPCKVCCPP